jgi:hypothetical protein
VALSRISRTTAWRYVNEVAELQAAGEPKVRDAKRPGYAYIILDGTVIAVDHLAAHRRLYSCKHREHSGRSLTAAGTTWRSRKTAAPHSFELCGMLHRLSRRLLRRELDCGVLQGRSLLRHSIGSLFGDGGVGHRARRRPAPCRGWRLPFRMLATMGTCPD